MPEINNFDPFLREWGAVRQVVLKRIDDREAGRQLAGSVDELERLIAAIDALVGRLHDGDVAPVHELSRHFHFTATWSFTDELGLRLRGLTRAYRRALFHARPTPESP